MRFPNSKSTDELKGTTDALIYACYAYYHQKAQSSELIGDNTIDKLRPRIKYKTTTKLPTMHNKCSAISSI